MPKRKFSRFSSSWIRIFPEIADQADGWDPTAVQEDSKVQRPWRCERHHSYLMSVKNRLSGKSCWKCDVWERPHFVRVCDLARILEVPAREISNTARRIDKTKKFTSVTELSSGLADRILDEILEIQFQDSREKRRQSRKSSESQKLLNKERLQKIVERDTQEARIWNATHHDLVREYCSSCGVALTTAEHNCRDY
jgi:hypothetical protein